MDYLHPKLDDAAIARMSSLALAHVGDAVYEILVRTHLACGGTQTAKNLHSQTITLVRASAQAKAYQRQRRTYVVCRLHEKVDFGL